LQLEERLSLFAGVVAIAIAAEPSGVPARKAAEPVQAAVQRISGWQVV
jgi:hypothetical protein